MTPRDPMTELPTEAADRERREMAAEIARLRAEVDAANARTLAAVHACYADAASLAQTMADKWRTEGDTIAGGALKGNPTGKIVIDMVTRALDSVAKMTAEVPARMGDAIVAHALRAYMAEREGKVTGDDAGEGTT